MAKTGEFESKQPATYSTEGINLRDLIRFAAGKGEGEEVTSQDFDSLLSKSGVDRKTSRNLTKAFSTVQKNANLDYVLSTSGDSFNVFDKTTGEALTKSSRKTGSTKGATFADLIKLGDNVSSLAGFASNKIGDYIKPKNEVVPKEEVVTPNKNVPTTDPATLQTGMKDYLNQGKKSSGKAPAKKAGPLDKITSNPNMRQFMFNTPVAPAEEKSQVPEVNLPTMSSETATKIKQVQQKASDDAHQRDYNIYLKKRYTLLHEYLSGKEANPSNFRKLQLSGDVSKLKSKQPQLYEYLNRYHKKQLDNLTGKTVTNGSY